MSVTTTVLEHYTDKGQRSMQRLGNIIGGRTVAIMLHGSSINELEHRIDKFRHFDFCYCGLNYFRVIEDKILKKIDKELSFVYCSSKEEIPKRIGDIEEFLNRLNGKMFITTVDAMQGLTGFTDKYRDKILFVNNPKLTEEKMSNSLTALMLAIVASHSTSKIILFGADGLLGNQSNAINTYFGKEKLKYLKAWEFDNRSCADCSSGFELSNSLKFLDYFKQNNVRTILDAGCGSGKLLKRKA